jgi:hypothetical protein
MEGGKEILFIYFQLVLRRNEQALDSCCMFDTAQPHSTCVCAPLHECCGEAMGLAALQMHAVFLVNFSLPATFCALAF